MQHGLGDFAHGVAREFPHDDHVGGHARLRKSGMTSFFMSHNKTCTFCPPHLIVVAKSEHQMKRNEISRGSSENGRGVKQAASSGALRKAAPMPNAALLPEAPSTSNGK